MPTSLPQEDRAARVVLGAVLLFAVVVQSQLFAVVHDMRGDLAYHRGVALTMTAGSWQGEGPVSGVMSYFGGLFPLVLGWSAEVTHADPDVLLSVVSWASTVTLPWALLVVGRRVWPGAVLEPALLVLVGTVGSSLALSRDAAWVYSVLPSGTNQWPLYPRDVAVVLLYAALATALGGPSSRRALATGLVCAVAIGTHAQVGAYATAVATVLVAVVHRSSGAAWSRSVLAAAASGLTAAVASAWWWWPRLLLARDIGGMDLRSHPLLPSLDTTPWGLLDAYGLVGVLGVAGLAATVRGTPVQRFFGVWLLVLLPGVLAEPLLGDQGVITGRRIWLFAGIPLVVCAAAGAAWLLRRLPRDRALPALVLLAVCLAVPSTIEVVQTRALVDASWQGPGDDLGADDWGATLSSLRSETRAGGGVVVVAPDNDAASLWEQTGAQPFSLLLNGRNKIGYDLERTTGTSYVDRVRLQQEAFAGGRTGLCRLAGRVGADRIVLRHADGLLGLHDLRPSAAFRVDPSDRDRSTIRRRVAPGVDYLDLNSTEVLSLEEGATIPVGFAAANATLLEVGFRGTSTDAPLELVHRDGSRLAGTRRLLHVEGFAVSGVPRGALLRATRPVQVSRVTAYEPHRLSRDVPGRGAVDLSTADLCG